MFSSILTTATAFALLLGSAYGAFNGSVNNNAVYWGQNSYGQGTGDLAQKPLASYCADTNFDVILMAFLYQMTTGHGGEPVINLANQGNNCTLFNGTQLMNCPQIGETSQPASNSFTTADQATSMANLIWATFGPVSSTTSAVDRPFGSAVVDGFNFDFENTVNNMISFGQTLRSLMDADTSKKYYLTAAPQCPYPDAADGVMLNNTVSFDAVFVQYYNNFCGIQSYVANATTQNNFNFDVWDTWAKTESKNSNVKVLLGVPAGPSAAGSGYLPTSQLTPVIQYCQTFPSFGGVMM
ncbi:Chitinase 2 [Recurvomyces mirabilis]|uniref:chitinase n=1 Tax=Recurvomyces mirabilis TaxID=574656 RepID=A0AAE0WHR5_9PEZI|nr:Chitinase 2 [Recurvomyces mirabilis]KAK5149456.1 Chitinase 2 [Recurvomyces mirabilis]